MGKKSWFDDYSKFLALGLLSLFTPWTALDPTLDEFSPLDPLLYVPGNVETFVLTDVYNGNPFARSTMFGTPPQRDVDDGPQLDFDREDMLVPDANEGTQFEATTAQDDISMINSDLIDVLMRSDLDAEKEAPTASVLDEQNLFHLDPLQQKEASYLIGNNRDSNSENEINKKLGFGPWEFQPEQLLSDEIFKNLDDEEKLKFYNRGSGSSMKTVDLNLWKENGPEGKNWQQQVDEAFNTPRNDPMLFVANNPTPTSESNVEEIPTPTIDFSQEQFYQLFENPQVQNDIENFAPDEFPDEYLFGPTGPINFAEIQSNNDEVPQADVEITIDSEGSQFSDPENIGDHDYVQESGSSSTSASISSSRSSPSSGPSRAHNPILVISRTNWGSRKIENQDEDENEVKPQEFGKIRPKQIKKLQKEDRSNIAMGKSRDDPELRKLGKMFGFSATVDEITALSTDDFQRFVSDKPHVVQDYLKKLRRRGKNKMAARNSRARKEDRVVTLEERVNAMLQTRDDLFAAKQVLSEEIADEEIETRSMLLQMLNEIPSTSSGGNRRLGNFQLVENADGNVVLIKFENN